MRTVAHISDLHFGRIDPRVVEALVEDLAEQKPSLAIISGDLTQRARRSQFREARAFLDRLPMPLHGNSGQSRHPELQPVRPVHRPLPQLQALYQRGVCPIHQDDDLAVVGINTVRSLIWDFAEGQINPNRSRRFTGR